MSKQPVPPGSEAVPSLDAPPPATEGEAVEGGEVVEFPAPAKPKTAIGQVIARLLALGSFHLLEDEDDVVAHGGHLVTDGEPPTLILHPADYAVWKSRLDAMFAEKKLAEVRQLRALRVGLKFRDNHARYEIVRLFPDEVKLKASHVDHPDQYVFQCVRRSVIEATLAHPACVIESAAEQPAPPEA